MNLISYRLKKTILIVMAMLILSSGCSSSPKPSTYNELGLFDLVQGKEDRIHSSRVAILDTKISNKQEHIRLYENKIRATKQAMNDLRIEISSYQYLLQETSKKITTLDQLNGWLIQLNNQIENVEKEYLYAQQVLSGLERINKREFLGLKNKGHFSDLTWLDYLDILKEIDKAKKAIEEKIRKDKEELRIAKQKKEEAKQRKYQREKQQAQVQKSRIEQEKIRQQNIEIEKKDTQNIIIKVKDKTSWLDKGIKVAKKVCKYIVGWNLFGRFFCFVGELLL